MKAEILACCCCYLVKTISILRVDSYIKLCHRCYFGTLVRADHYNLDAVSRCLRRPKAKGTEREKVGFTTVSKVKCGHVIAYGKLAEFPY